MADLEVQGDIEVRIQGPSGNTADVTSDGKLKVDASFTASEVKITDNDGDIAEVTPDGRLKVSQGPPEAPAGYTAVNRTGYSDVLGYADDVYVIPSGKTLVLQRLSGSGESSTTGSAIELWYDPNGDGSSMTIIDVIYVNGSSFQHDLNSSYVGDGTKAIRMRRKRLGGGRRYIFGRWEGYTD